MNFGTMLKDVLIEGTVITPADGSGNRLVLREDQADMAVTVADGSTEMVALRLKAGACRIGLLGERGPWNVSCDYILFGYIDSHWYAIFVELKKTARRDSHGYEQLRWSLPVLEYILQICELKFGCAMDRPRVSYVLLAEEEHERLDKQLIKTPDLQFQTVEWQGITIREIIGHRFQLRDLVESD